MRIFHITRKIKAFKLVYSIQDNQEVSGSGRCTMGLLFQYLRVTNNNDSFVLRQKNLLLQLLSIIPILNLFVRVPYYFYRKTERRGILKYAKKDSGYVLQDGKDKYVVRPHNHNICSICKNDIQIVKVEKKLESWFEENQYTISATDNVVPDLPLLLVLCMFIDVTYYKNYRQWSAHKKEINIVWNDPYPELAEWTPD